MLTSIRIAIVREAQAQSARNPSPIIHFVDEDNTGFEGDLTAVVPAHDTRPFRHFNLGFVLVSSVFLRSLYYYFSRYRVKALTGEKTDVTNLSEEGYGLEIMAGKTNSPW